MIMNELNRNEMCECGHFGGNSHGMVNSHKANFEKGHGECVDCNCEQFTWVAFIDKHGNDESRKWDRI